MKFYCYWISISFVLLLTACTEEQILPLDIEGDWVVSRGLEPGCEIATSIRGGFIFMVLNDASPGACYGEDRLIHNKGRMWSIYERLDYETENGYRAVELTLGGPAVKLVGKTKETAKITLVESDAGLVGLVNEYIDVYSWESVSLSLLPSEFLLEQVDYWPKFEGSRWSGTCESGGTSPSTGSRRTVTFGSGDFPSDFGFESSAYIGYCGSKDFNGSSGASVSFAYVVKGSKVNPAGASNIELVAGVLALSGRIETADLGVTIDQNSAGVDTAHAVLTLDKDSSFVMGGGEFKASLTRDKK